MVIQPIYVFLNRNPIIIAITTSEGALVALVTETSRTPPHRGREGHIRGDPQKWPGDSRAQHIAEGHLNSRDLRRALGKAPRIR